MPFIQKSKKIYDVIVIGTGAGGSSAIKFLCEAGLKVLALNSGKRLDPAKDYRNHPYAEELFRHADVHVEKIELDRSYLEAKRTEKQQFIARLLQRLQEAGIEEKELKELQDEAHALFKK